MHKPTQEGKALYGVEASDRHGTPLLCFRCKKGRRLFIVSLERERGPGESKEQNEWRRVYLNLKFKAKV